jgi:hypothetical protein
VESPRSFEKALKRRRRIYISHARVSLLVPYSSLRAFPRPCARPKFPMVARIIVGDGDESFLFLQPRASTTGAPGNAPEILHSLRILTGQSQFAIARIFYYSFKFSSLCTFSVFAIIISLPLLPTLRPSIRRLRVLRRMSTRICHTRSHLHAHTCTSD